jgi:hypothetical protein
MAPVVSDITELTAKLVRNVVGYLDCDIPKIADSWRDGAQWVLDQAEEAGQLSALFYGLLDLYALAARRLYSDDGLASLYAALS